MKNKSAAIVSIKNAPNMTAKGRKDVVKWLRQTFALRTQLQKINGKLESLAALL